jgi:hypothetical protein
MTQKFRARLCAGGDLRADRGTNLLARQAVLGERAGYRRSNPSI